VSERGKLYIQLGELRPLAAGSAATGVSLPGALAAAGLDACLLEKPDSTLIDLAAYFRFWQYAAEAARDETMGVSQRSLIPGSTHFVLSRVIGCGTLLDAMKEIAKAYNFLHGGNFNRVELQKDRLAYVIDDAAFPYAPGASTEFRHFAMECVLIFLHSVLVLIATDALDAKLKKVHVRRARRPRQERHLDFWHAPLRFKSDDYALLYHPSAATLPIGLAPEDLPPARAVFSKIAALIERREASLTGEDRVVERVAALLKENDYSQQHVARRLGLSVASLRRKLVEEGTAFRNLRRSVKNERARFLLSSGASIVEVAESLGFSDFRSFSRAFKSWNRITPAEFRAAK
jgi:AraC-like DNA-binding protein